MMRVLIAGESVTHSSDGGIADAMGVNTDCLC